MSRRLDAALRRLLDISAAVAGLLILSPALMLIALVVRLSSAGPILYRARRVGTTVIHPGEIVISEPVIQRLPAVAERPAQPRYNLLPPPGSRPM